MSKALLILCILATVACVKKPDLRPDYGPAVSISDIQKAAFSAAPPDPFSIRQGQFISIDEVQVINTLPPTVYFQRTDEVMGVSEDTTTLSLAFKVSLNELDSQGQWKPSISPYNLTFLKGNSVAEAMAYAQSLRASEDSDIKPYTLKKMKTLDATKPKVTYHNLKQAEGWFDTPVSVLSKPNCGYVPNCNSKMRYLEVSFDRVIWESEDRGTKTAMRFIYSPDMPTYIEDWTNEDGIYFTNLYKTCVQTFQTITQGQVSQVVPVLGCAEISDFQFGKPKANP
jgi:hypothetical protein